MLLLADTAVDLLPAAANTDPAGYMQLAADNTDPSADHNIPVVVHTVVVHIGRSAGHNSPVDHNYQLSLIHILRETESGSSLAKVKVPEYPRRSALCQKAL